MNLEQIKRAVCDGKTVHWRVHSYTVVQDAQTGVWYIEHCGGVRANLVMSNGELSSGGPENYYVD